VEKAIFSISCTTCRARLAVRSEAAIGEILECPRCQSMVQIVPPPGWTPAPPPAVETAAGPPPLDHVANGPLGLELEPVDTSPLGTLLRHVWPVTGAALVVLLVGVGTIYWLLAGPTEPEPVAASNERPATVTEDTVAPLPSAGAKPKESDAAKRPAATSPATAKEEAATPEAESPEQPAIRPASPLPPETKPTNADPAAPVAKKPDKSAGTDEKGREEVKPEGKQPETKKSPPPQVDVTARMADPLPGIELTEVPLARAIELLATAGTLPITLDADALRQVGAGPRDPISLRLESTTVGEALQAVAAKRGLAVTVENGQVILATPAEQRETLRTVPYTVSDLTGDDKAATAEFAALLRKLVVPESWQGAAGRGTIEAKQGSLVVTQTRDIHEQVVAFCEKLRNARKKPLRRRERPERFTLATRTSQAREMLERPVTANFHEPAALGKILAFVAKATDTDILIDHAALAAAESSVAVETSLTVEKKPLGAVLADSLRPLGLAYRVVGPSVIQVTTSEAAEERMELEFYPVAKQLSGGATAVKLIERLKTAAAAATWSDGGGSGEVYFDAPAQCLIVLQSQPAQAAIERLMAAKEK
jgi:hypothetical protein